MTVHVSAACSGSGRKVGGTPSPAYVPIARRGKLDRTTRGRPVIQNLANAFAVNMAAVTLSMDNAGIEIGQAAVVFLMIAGVVLWFTNFNKHLGKELVEGGIIIGLFIEFVVPVLMSIHYAQGARRAGQPLLLQCARDAGGPISNAYTPPAIHGHALPTCPKCEKFISASHYERHLRRCGTTHRHETQSLYVPSATAQVESPERGITYGSPEPSFEKPSWRKRVIAGFVIFLLVGTLVVFFLLYALSML